MATENAHVIAMRIHLKALKSRFDSAMCIGESFAALKKIYMEIKELECYIKVMEWKADKLKNPGYYKRLRFPLL